MVKRAIAALLSKDMLLQLSKSLEIPKCVSDGHTATATEPDMLSCAKAVLLSRDMLLQLTKSLDIPKCVSDGHTALHYLILDKRILILAKHFNKCDKEVNIY